MDGWDKNRYISKWNNGYIVDFNGWTYFNAFINPSAHFGCSLTILIDAFIYKEKDSLKLLFQVIQY